MADGNSGGDQDPFYTVIGLILVLFIVSGLLSAIFGFDILGEGSDTNRSNATEGFSLSRIFPVGNIALGEKIINKKEVDVYRRPNIGIIGSQNKREVGKVIEGPVGNSDRVWWRIDYKNAPDGWVRQSNMTEYVWTYRAFNIIPITFGALTPFMILISIILVVLIIIVMVKTNRLDELKIQKKKAMREKTLKQKVVEDIEKEEVEELEGAAPKTEEDKLISVLPTGSDVPKTQDVHNRRWSKVESLINSHSVNDWKQAIIEADIILDEMLEKMGYKGDSIGDKLKQVEESDFMTLNQAWEAHKIRNRIAHKGSEYVLSRNDAERAFNLFKEVFEEFYFI